MIHLCRPLKPDGTVTLVKTTDNKQIRTPFLFGTLPDYCVSIDEATHHCPAFLLGLGN